MKVDLSIGDIRAIISALDRPGSLSPTVPGTEDLIEKLETTLEGYKPRTIEELAEYYEVREWLRDVHGV